MKDWKFVRTGNETVGPNWDKKRQLEDELRGWMTMVNKLEGEEKRNAEKQISEIRKELNDVKIRIAHGENKKAGNESIDKQTWSMFKGLTKDAEKEVGNKKYHIWTDNGTWDRIVDEEELERLKTTYKNFHVEEVGNETLGQWAKAKPRVINETAEEKKFGKVMREFDRGELKSGSGEKVTDPEQAKAIAYSESEKVKNDFFGDHIKILGIPDKPQEPAKPQNGLSRARNSMAKK